MTASASITRRLILSVLLLEVLAAFVLIATVTNHERRVRLRHSTRIFEPHRMPCLELCKRQTARTEAFAWTSET
jgi:hypothetical protein